MKRFFWGLRLFTFFLYTLGILTSLKAQSPKDSLLSLAELRTLKVYTSLEEARKEAQAVKVLDLGNQELKDFPLEILDFPNLQKLSLYQNQIEEIPNEIQKLDQLRYLDLYDNRLRQLPEGFTSLNNLLYLDLGDNQFKQIPENLLELSGLEFLFIYGNKIRKLPEDLPRLGALRALRLGGGFRFFFGGNRIKKLPENFGEIHNLEELYLPDNRLRSLPASFQNLDQLTWLDLGHNRFSKIPAEIYPLKQLKYLSLWDRNFPGREKENAEREMLNTQFSFTPDFEGSFTALGLGFQQGRFSVLDASLTRAFKKDILVMALGLGAEYNLNGEMGAVKAFFQANGLTVLALGMQGGYYFTSEKNALFLRPEIGWGWSVWSLTYGYNILFNSGLDHINTHSINLRLLLPINPSFSIFR